jgi:hypothetical protein
MFLFEASAVLLDITTNTSYYSRSGLLIYRWSEDEVDSTAGCYSCVTGPAVLNRTFIHVYNFTSSFNGSDKYEVDTEVRGEVTAEVLGWSGVATASLNMASFGHGYTLNAVRIW